MKEHNVAVMLLSVIKCVRYELIFKYNFFFSFRGITPNNLLKMNLYIRFIKIREITD